MRKILVGLILAVLLTMALAVPAMAGNTQSVTVTATPSFVSIANTPGTWTMNGVKGDGLIDIDTIYYAIGAAGTSDTTAPVTTVADADCRFTLTDTSSVNITLKVTMEDFASGSDPMLNAESADNGEGTYSAYSYYSGLAYPSGKVLVKEVANIGTTGVLYTSTTPGGADIKWAAQVETQTDVWTGGTSSTATLTITAAKV